MIERSSYDELIDAFVELSEKSSKCIRSLHVDTDIEILSNKTLIEISQLKDDQLEILLCGLLEKHFRNNSTRDQYSEWVHSYVTTARHNLADKLVPGAPPKTDNELQTAVETCNPKSLRS